MNIPLDQSQRISLLIGRALLGVYFILPGIQKIFAFEAMSSYMAAHGVPLITVALIITIILQVGAGASLLLGYKTALMAFILALLTLVISIYMHDFWGMEEGIARDHETQNFFKNMGIMAGLLFAAGVQPAKSG